MDSASYAVEKTTFTFPSPVVGTTMHATLWAPAGNGAPRALLQVTHGMAEHMGRYDRLARFFAEQGYAVCGFDYAGHGQTAQTPEEYGCLPAKRGKDDLLGSVHALRGLMTERFGADIPYFIYGHSMGSFVVRAYLARNGAGLAGAVLCGTGYQPPAVANAGLAFAQAVCATKGENHRSSTIHNMAMGSYGKAIPGATTEFDWLSTDPAQVQAYIDDNQCGFMFSAGGYVVLMGLLAEIAPNGNVGRIPKNLPVLFIAGADDPVGDKGAGVLRVYKQYKDMGIQDVDLRLYLGMRHEVHNEPGYAKVFGDMLSWLEGRM